MLKLTLLDKFGHYYWYDAASEEIVVSDETADHYDGYGNLLVGNPCDTEDGVLLLDKERLDVPKTFDSAAEHMIDELCDRLPVKDPSGYRMYLSAVPREYKFAFMLIKWLKTDPISFRVAWQCPMTYRIKV